MERYVFVRDSESNHIFTENKPYNFKVQLKLPLSFNGYWKVALCEISIKTDPKARRKTVDNTLFIYSNVCKESVVDGGERPLLRRIEKNEENGWNYVLESPFYLPLNRSEFQEIDFSIKTVENEYASFVSSPVHLTLHFKRYPFYPKYESI